MKYSKHSLLGHCHHFLIPNVEWQCISVLGSIPYCMLLYKLKIRNCLRVNVMTSTNSSGLVLEGAAEKLLQDWTFKSEVLSRQTISAWQGGV